MCRAAREQVRAKRTWFVTFTFAPRTRATILAQATQDGRGSQVDRLIRHAGWFVSTYTKRLRKAGFRFRYIVIAEPHADGFPHFHGIVHDQLGNTSVKEVWKRDPRRPGLWKKLLVCPELETAWSAGYVETELVRDLGAIRYITKYLAKGRFGRVRSSLGYGAEIGESENERPMKKSTRWRRTLRLPDEALRRRREKSPKRDDDERKESQENAQLPCGL